MNREMNGAPGFARANFSRFVDELKEFIRFRSVSAQPKRREEVEQCARWMARHLQAIGLRHVRVIRTPGHPIVYADWQHARNRPTVLLYGHYDVQPPEPLKEWHSPPFSAVVRGDNFYGRGASDDKGQVFAHVKALEALLKTGGALPVNVKCLYEGEEEIGSPHVQELIERQPAGLRADVAVVSDMPIPAPDQPAITYAMRGGLSLELEVHGPKRDLHSGLYGGAVHNPLQALSEMLARMHDDSGRVVMPGFHDRVLVPDADERFYLAEIGPSDARVLHDAGAARAWGEAGYSEYERTTIRPALTINGIAGGYQGAGSKGVIPARALAKLSFRLVPDQDPREIEHLFRDYVARITPRTVKVAVRAQGHAWPIVIGRRHPAVRAAAFAYRKAFGRAPVFLRCGGTIPVVSSFRRFLKIPTVLMGFALPDDRMHAPDEKFYLPNFYRGIETSIWFLNAMARVGMHDESVGRIGIASGESAE